MRHIRNAQRGLQQRLERLPGAPLGIRVARELGADDASHMAAGVAYYAILSLFPLLLGLIAVLGFVLPSDEVQAELFEFFRNYLPASIDLLERNITDVIKVRGALGALSIVGLFWSASAMFGAISRAINRAWDIHQDRPFLARKSRELAMALGTGLLLPLSLGASYVFTALDETAFDPGFVGSAGAGLAAILLNFSIILLLYKFMPNTKTYWRYVWPGAMLAALLLEIAKSLFVLYVGSLARYDLIYGSVSSVIALLLWVYLSAFILILGAEVSSEYERSKRNVARRTPPAATPDDLC